MHFMYELGDFKKLLAEKYPNVYSTTRRPVPTKGLARTMTDSFLIKGNSSMSPMDTIADESGTEYTSGSDPYDSRGSQYATDHDTPITPGPSSAPVGTQWSPKVLPDSYSHEPEQQSLHAPPPPSRAPPVPPKDSLPDLTPRRASSSAESVDKDLPPLPKLDLAPPPVHVDNQATSRDQLPPPNLVLPTPTPPRRLRPMPSLPSGFHSTIQKRTPPREKPFRGIGNLTLSTSLSPNPKPLQPDEESGESLLSPREEVFTASPFHRSSAGDLAGFSFEELMSPRTQERDPRSPPTRGEAPIIRNIEDVL